MLSPILYLPHGGGPLPILGEPGHKRLVEFLTKVPEHLGMPTAILVVSAHWEEEHPTVTSGSRPELIYDYYGFPEESYQITYDAPGDPQLAREVADLITSSGLVTGDSTPSLDGNRGFDHGMFIPLKLMYPAANIPCIQLSLLGNLDPKDHVNLGKALASLRHNNILIIGSGLSVHNMEVFRSPDACTNKENDEFNAWLIETCTSEQLLPADRERRLLNWDKAPSARFCHPREEHLLPLHVCFGAALADSPVAELVFHDEIMGQRAVSLLWR